jgi:NAD(P)-dependent dehydrogenase (short-subunit alcohol dehydrogenase family)
MQTDGAIINIGAVVGFRGFPEQSVRRLEGSLRSDPVLAIELAKRQIRVNLVIPGWIETEAAGASGAARDASLRAYRCDGRHRAGDRRRDLVGRGPRT